MKSKLKKQKGVLTLDFLFSVMAVYGITLVFGCLALVLVLSSVGQYISFSVNRAHISSHIDRQQQALAAQTKYDIIARKFLPFIGRGPKAWVKMTGPVPLSGETFDTSNPGGKRQKKYGYAIQFSFDFLKKVKAPILGSPADGADPNFGKARLKSILYREPSTMECLEFNSKRWKKILDRFPNLKNLTDSSRPFGAQADNGC